MIVNANLAKGAIHLVQKKAIVKRLDAVQTLGAIDILCSDKTGTLTKDDIALDAYIDVDGHRSLIVLQLAYLNAKLQAGLKNLLDVAITSACEEVDLDFTVLASETLKFAEVPFDFVRRKLSIVVKKDDGLLLISKGAFEEIIKDCAFVRQGTVSQPLDTSRQALLYDLVNRMNGNGFRVVAVASRPCQEHELIGGLSSSCEKDLVLEGLLSFLDPPKEDAALSVQQLSDLGVTVKILTGDNAAVAFKVSVDIGILAPDQINNVITGPELGAILDPVAFTKAVERCSVFAKLSPVQKSQIVLVLKKAGHRVGFLGDGTNDAMGLQSADVGISVNTGSAIAKDAANVILTEKSLGVIVDGVRVGRLTYANTLKYIYLASSSNFGNVFSIVAASAWLPYNPMRPLQLLVQNLLYDLSQTAIPWDNVDPELLNLPREWSIKSLGRFMLCFGPTSSVFDITTFSLNWWYYGIQNTESDYLVRKAQTQWFTEGLLTQTLVVHMLRTAKVPFLQSRASWQVLLSTFGLCGIGLSLPWLPFARSAFEFETPFASFYGFLAAEITAYIILVAIVKKLYIRMFGVLM